VASTVNWPTKRLGDLAEFRNGVNYNKNSFGEGVKVVGVSDFQDYTKPKYDELEQINPEGVVTERNILRDGDIIFVRSNGNRELIGRSLFIEKPTEEVTHSAFTIRLRFNSREVHPKFYAYCFRTSLIRQGLTASGGGTNISNLNQDILNALEVPFPPLPVQERIAGVLSAYDDLIENIQRRIRILEEIARALYREWFVEFRFPGHEKVSRIASTIGDIPQGWEVKKLGDVVTIDKGVSYNGAGLTDDGNPMVNLKNIEPGGGFRRDATKPYSGDFKPRHTVKSGDVVLANTDLTQAGNVVASAALIPPLGDDKPILISHHLFAVRPIKDIPPIFLYHHMLSEDFRGFARGFAIGTTVLGLPKEGVLNHVFACPPPSVVSEFMAHVSPMHELIETLHTRNEILRRARDLLLPRLLSGQLALDVRD
jgi:type I restriction enzyme, S subunit